MQVLIADRSRERGAVVGKADAEVVTRLEVDAQWVQRDLAADCGGAGRTRAVTVEAGRTAQCERIVDQIELQRYAFGHLESRVEWVGGIGSVSQSTARPAQCARPLALDAKRKSVRLL